ncbi:hypothetical protein ONS95_000294 [Cadophora gregata]|uniref:uncharacterized protein n=1 Tax=Cadophora gregata TaxID=51156 RepID=UPI0026DD366D|nr:uncharacterized protein ONS95_000294 [Cadophora gregata]KAK0125704.1 hypothetical protein ONS96_009536 [Cadophora gregata f. sp. sojae]KAK0128319.1 hypothetical protein ONS95_000294 [Cadophora gregata]
MFDNSNIQYINSMGGDCFSSTRSANSSFSDGSSATWDSSTVYTPMSTPRRGSPNSVKYEHSVLSAPTPSSSPDRYANMSGLSAMTAMSQNMVSMFHEPHSSFTGTSNTNSTPDLMAGFSYGPYLGQSMSNSFSSSHGLPMCAPGLIHDDIYSPVSEVRSSPPILENCIAPSQTTFDAYGLQSPMHPIKSLHFNIDYDCAARDFETGFSVDESSPGSMRYMMADSNNLRSGPSTPSRTPSHHRYHQSHASNSLDDLRHELKVETNQAKKLRLVRKRSKGGSRAYEPLSSSCSSIGINPKASFPCDWEGCSRKFARQEHLKRHQRTHDDVKEKCEFCPKLFSISRKDNYKTHMRLHAFPQKGNRTPFFPEALDVWMAMDDKPRKASPTSFVKTEKRSVQRIARTRL